MKAKYKPITRKFPRAGCVLNTKTFYHECLESSITCLECWQRNYKGNRDIYKGWWQWK